MNSAFEMTVPQSMPQVSRLRAVFAWAWFKNVVRRVGGRKTVRNGAPPSVNAFGLNVTFEAVFGAADELSML
jgi:hypothetical protein